jgi:hypothetical protein
MELLTDTGTVTIFNPLCATQTYSVPPNNWSVCLAISVTTHPETNLLPKITALAEGIPLFSGFPGNL